MRNGPQFDRKQFEGLQQQDLLGWFAPHRHTVEFDVVVLDHEDVSPTNSEDL